MDSTKEKHFNSGNQTLKPNESHIFPSVLSAIEAPEGLKRPLLKSLYYLLIHLSSDPRCTPKHGAALNDLDMESYLYGIRVAFKDIHRLSDVLFRELSQRFKQLLSDLHDVSKSSALYEADLHLDMWATVEKVNLLLRCCMVVLNLLSQQYFLENGLILLAILRKLSSLDLIGSSEENAISFEKSVSRECAYSYNEFSASCTEDFVASLCLLEPSDPCLPFLSAMLEVFADELLVHRQIRENFKLIDSISCTREMLFMYHSGYGNIGIVMEVISNHFVLSYSVEQTFENFLNRLFWVHDKDFRAPEMSLTAATSLLLNPVLLSAPKFYQAHLIFLVSESTSIGMGFENLKPDLRLLDCYLSVLESSVIFYSKHMSTYQMGFKPSVSGGDFQPSFESCIRPVTRKKINDIITKLDDSWHLHIRNMFFKTESDLVVSSIAYVKENEYLLDISCRDEILSILNCIILRVSCDVNHTTLHMNESTSSHDIFLLASILKLMSSSLLQAIWCLRHSGNMGCLRTLKNYSSCKEYNSIMCIISYLSAYNICFPIQQFLCDVMETHPTRHKTSKLMLFHLLGLLSLSFSSGLDFLVKGCISTIMAVMTLFIFEEGNLAALASLIDSCPGSNSSGLPLDHVQEAVVDTKSSLMVASKFQKIQTFYLSTASLAGNCTGVKDGQEETLADASVLNDVERVVAVEEEAIETCNGEIFLKCIRQQGEKSSELDDIADFIECKQGKDYNSWLKDRQRYRKWKCDKMAVLRWNKMKRTWKYMKGKSI